MSADPELGAPLDRVTSIKVKLGALVAASVGVAAVLATLGATGSVPAWLSIPVAILLALAITQLLATGMTSPLREMTQAARQMATGDYSGRVRATSRDEVGELARAFNKMAEDLATVDRERRALVANVSHELRTPLAALCALLENLADGVSEPDPAGLAAALDQAERLSTLTADLLDLSRVDAGILAFADDQVPVAAFLDEVVSAAHLAGRGVTYDLRVTPPDLTIRGDRARLTQLVTNLLDNAARHSPAGGTVWVSAEAAESGADSGAPPRSPSTWRLEVADQGGGIGVADRERVFERFGTLREQDGPTGGGTGLGLAIARWVTDLHGGSIRVVDPLTGESGARVRAELPLAPTPHLASHRPLRTTKESPVTQMTPTAPGPGAGMPVVPAPLLKTLFGSAWPEDDLAPRPRLLVASLVVGVLAGIALPFRGVGIGTFVVLVAAGATVLVASKHRRDPFTLSCAVLCLLLASVVVLRDADWITSLCLLAGAVVCVVGLGRGRTLPGFVTAGLAWPLAGLRGLPWLGRSLRGFTGFGNGPAMLRTAIWSVLAVSIFGLLFGSADALFATWVNAVLPDLHLDGLVFRGFVTVAVAGVVLAAVYLGLNPPDVEPAAGTRRPVRNRYEWLAPVLLVDAVFVLFVSAQAAVFFGGRDYLRRTTGLTYAEYVHQGFAQLTIATALMLLVVAAAARKAPRETAADRAWLRGALGVLCAVTLVVVGSALYRMHVYQQAYGFTRLRLLVDVFEGWLGLVVLMVVAAGLRLSAGWLARTALLTGASTLLALALVNPDAWIARHNLDRYESSGKVDWGYLRGLSADAAPTLAKLPARQRACVLGSVQSYDDGDWLGWNLSRARARAAVREAGPAGSAAAGSCRSQTPTTARKAAG